MKRRIARWTRSKMPTRGAMAGNRFLAPIAHRFLSPELWRFTRRSVPRGVALGLFSSFIIPFGQIFLAAFLALPLRANVPLAAMVTFVTNPFTLPFWLVTATRVGQFVFKVDLFPRPPAHIVVGGSGSGSSLWDQIGWSLEVAGITAFGFVVLAVVSAAVGYVVSSFLWRWWIARKRMRLLSGPRETSMNKPPRD
ncbi:DUF2062 domain-containing protein [Croceicoccus sp. F390]|uniref:DUF2062 domain-containing protein n=1 Tax=Croceicoccus esteveae TaxID=3075597 RepID=A0ABU2ZEX8_9SPHN|nr:DUF2062 domain-containing protein [Croceicoccus sp. F390]MDT0574849.1 DUF2062 domain-containing protein [Croceicoccus sp. F390]